MALRRIWHDTFGYGSFAAFLAAYPYDPPTDTSTSATGGDTNAHLYMAVGPTSGPSGGPGLENTDGTFHVGFDKVIAAPGCRYMAEELTYDFSGFAPALAPNQNGNIMTVFSYEVGDRAGSFDGYLLNIVRRTPNSNLSISVRTTAAYGNAGTPATTYFEELSGAFPADGPHKLRAYLHLSELTETSPGSGVYAPSTDGFAKVYLDDVEIFSFAGPVWHGDSGVGLRKWTAVSIAWGGKVGGAFDIYDSDECSPAPTVNDSTPCCGDKVPSGGGGTTPGDVIPPASDVTLPPWTPICPGGGTVQTAADIADDENWTSPALVPCVRAHLEVERDAGDVTLLMSKRPMPDFDEFTEPRVLSYGTIRRSLSDDQGQPEMSTGSVTVSINDDDEPIRPALEENRSRFIRTTEAAIEILSEAGRRAVSTWRSLLRGRVEEPSLTIQRNGLQRSRQAVLPIVDAWAPFYDKVVNDARFLRANFPNIDRALEGKCIPIIGGEHSDRGAEDVAGNNAEKGLVPGYYVGPWHTVNDDPLTSKPTTYSPPTGLAFTVNGTPGSTTLYYAVTQRNAAGETTLSEIVQVDTAAATLSGTDSIHLDWVSDPLNYTVVYRGRYPTPSRRVKVLAPGVSTWTDTGVDPELPPGPPQINTAQIPDEDGQFNFWGLIVIGLGDLGDVVPFGSNVAPGVAPARINLTETAGRDLLVPRLPGWPYPTNTLRIGGDDVFAVLARGSRLQQHIDGIVTFAFQVCGMVDEDGRSIQQAFPLLQEILTQFVPTDGGERWRNGAKKPLREFSLGVPTLQPTQFEACQELTKEFLDNDEGYRGAIYLGLEPVTLRDLIQTFNQTFDAFWRVNHHGQGSPFLLNPFVDPATGSPYRERMEISRLEDPVFDRTNVQPRIAFQYDYDPDAGKYRSEIETIEDAAAVAALPANARDRGTELCPWSRDAATVRDAKRRRVQRLKYPRWKQPVVTKFNGLEDELGAQVLITHRDAPAANGWSGNPCYVEAHEVDLERKEVRLTCVDFLPTIEAFGELLGNEATTTELLGDETEVDRPLIGSEA